MLCSSLGLKWGRYSFICQTDRNKLSEVTKVHLFPKWFDPPSVQTVITTHISFVHCWPFLISLSEDGFNPKVIWKNREAGTQCFLFFLFASIFSAQNNAKLLAASSFLFPKGDNNFKMVIQFQKISYSTCRNLFIVRFVSMISHPQSTAPTSIICFKG